MSFSSKSLMVLGGIEAVAGIAAYFFLAATTGINDPSPGMAGVSFGTLTFMAGLAMDAAEKTEKSTRIYSINERPPNP